MEIGIGEIWIISADNGALHYVQFGKMTKTDFTDLVNSKSLKVPAADRFSGMKFLSVSSLFNTALLSYTGAVFLTGPMFSHLPAPPMVLWQAVNDKPVGIEISEDFLMIVSMKGHIYKLTLQKYWEPPQMIYDGTITPMKSARYAGENYFTSLSRAGVPFVWKEREKPNTSAVDLVYPPKISEFYTTPTPIRAPWPVEGIDLCQGYLVISSVRSFSYNVIFADFLNRAAVTAIRANSLLLSPDGAAENAASLRKVLDDPVNFASPYDRDSRDGSYGYQFSTLQAYGTSEYGGDRSRQYLGSSSASIYGSGMSPRPFNRFDSSQDMITPPSSSSSALRDSKDSSGSAGAKGSHSASAYGLSSYLAAQQYGNQGSYIYGRGRLNKLSLAPRRLSVSANLSPSLMSPMTTPRGGPSSSSFSLTNSSSASLRDSNISSPGPSLTISSAGPDFQLPSGFNEETLEDETLMYSFNNRLLKIYDLPESTPEEGRRKKAAFCKLHDDFMERSLEVVKVIIEELALEDEQKTYSSLPTAGGVAGGEKYLVDGNIFIKLCVDNNSLYGGNEWSSKIANLELHGSDAYASCIPKLPAGSKLRVPLIAMIDYGGFRAIVSTACPISKRTIVYGSNDAARTVHNDDPEAEKSMQQCAFLLNLAPHRVKNGNNMFLASAVDVEVHRGDDGYLYILDTARVFPPVAPAVSKSIMLGSPDSPELLITKDLSDAQAQALKADLVSVPISEGLLFFRRTEAGDEDSIRALHPNLIDKEMERLSFERILKGWDATMPITTKRQAPKMASGLTVAEKNFVGDLSPNATEAEKEEHQWQQAMQELSKFSEDDIYDAHDRLELMRALDMPNTMKGGSTSADVYVNEVATALLGRLVLGEAWFLRNEMGQRLWHQFRPEYVSGYTEPLSSDALSLFAVDGEIHDDNVKKATEFLDYAYMVLAKEQLHSTSPYLNSELMYAGKRFDLATQGKRRRKAHEPEEDEISRLAPLVYSTSTLVKFMHTIGLNVRHLGTIRLTSKLEAMHDICLMEMVTRVCTSFVKRRLRSAHSLFATIQHRMETLRFEEQEEEMQKENESKNSTSHSASSSSSSSSPDPNQASSSSSSNKDNRTGRDERRDQFESERAQRQRNATGGLGDWDKLLPSDIRRLSKKTLDELRNMLAVQAYKTLFSHSATASFFWTQVIKVQLLLKFGGECLFSHEISRGYDIRLNVHFAALFQAVSRRCGVVWDSETQRSLEISEWSTLPQVFSTEHIVGYALSSKASELGSLPKLKNSILNEFFPTIVPRKAEIPLPEFNIRDHDGETRQLFTDFEDYCSKRTRPDTDPLFEAMRSPAYKPELGPISTSNVSQSHDFEKDGLTQYHLKNISYYGEWKKTLQEAGLVLPVIDEARLRLSKIRLLLDNKCSSGGEYDMKIVEKTLKEIPELLREGGVAHVNHEFLANMYYARGQYHHLKGEMLHAERCYLAAVGVLAMPTFTVSNLSTLRQHDHLRDWNFYSPESAADHIGTWANDGWRFASRRAYTHPFGLIVIDKLLSIYVNHTGSIMDAFGYAALFRVSWNLCPFLGDITARKRLFNGHVVPLAFAHPYSWEFNLHETAARSGCFTYEPSKERTLFGLHIHQAVLPLDSPEIQYWLSQALSLEPSCGFELSSQWLIERGGPEYDNFSNFGNTSEAPKNDVLVSQEDQEHVSEIYTEPQSDPTAASSSSSFVSQKQNESSSSSSSGPREESSRGNSDIRTKVNCELWTMPLFPHLLRLMTPSTAFPHFTDKLPITLRHTHASWFPFLEVSASTMEDAWVWWNTGGSSDLSNLLEMERIVGTVGLQPQVLTAFQLMSIWPTFAPGDEIASNLMRTLQQQALIPILAMRRFLEIKTGVSLDSVTQADNLNTMIALLQKTKAIVEAQIPIFWDRKEDGLMGGMPESGPRFKRIIEALKVKEVLFKKILGQIIAKREDDGATGQGKDKSKQIQSPMKKGLDRFDSKVGQFDTKSGLESKKAQNEDEEQLPKVREAKLKAEEEERAFLSNNRVLLETYDPQRMVGVPTKPNSKDPRQYYTLGGAPAPLNRMERVTEQYEPVGGWHGLTVKYIPSLRDDGETNLISSVSMLVHLDTFKLLPACQVQYLDPEKPAPKRYIVRMHMRPERYNIVALPKWFDDRGVRSIHDMQVPPHVPGTSPHHTAFVGPPFVCITKDHHLSICFDILNDVPTDSDTVFMRSLNFAGETPLEIRVSKAEASLPKLRLEGKEEGHLIGPEVHTSSASRLYKPAILNKVHWGSPYSHPRSIMFNSLTGAENRTEEYKTALATRIATTYACLTASGKLFIWGANKRGLFGTGHSTNDFSPNPRVISPLFHHHLIDVRLGIGHILTLSKTGKIHFWGSVVPHSETNFMFVNAVAQWNASNPVITRPSEKELPHFNDVLPQYAIAIGACAHGIVVVSQYGIPYYFGIYFADNLYTKTTSDFERIWVPERIANVACGDWHILLLGESGNIYACGSNFNGECGTALPAYYISGMQRNLAPLTFDDYSLGKTNIRPKFIQIAASCSFSAALTEDGDIWAFGGCPQSSPYLLPRTPSDSAYAKDGNKTPKNIQFNDRGVLLIIYDEEEDIQHRHTLPLLDINVQRISIEKGHDLERKKAESDRIKQEEESAAKKTSRQLQEQAVQDMKDSWFSATPSHLKPSSSRPTETPTLPKREGPKEEEIEIEKEMPTDLTESVEMGAIASNTIDNTENNNSEGEEENNDEEDESNEDPSSSSAVVPRRQWKSDKFGGALVREQTKEALKYAPSRETELELAMRHKSGKELLQNIQAMIDGAMAPVLKRLNQLESRVKNLELKDPRER